MQGRGLLVVGLIAGAILATTPQGRKLMDDAKKKATDLWSNASETISDNVDKMKPTP